MSDQGRNVDGEVILKLCAKLGIDKRHSSPYHPEGDGLAERSIGTVKQVMGCLLLERDIPKTEWPRLLSEVSFTCNTLVNASTGLCPQELMYGNRLRGPIDAMLENNDAMGNLDEHDTVSELKRIQAELREVALNNSKEAKERIKSAYDKGKDSSITEGDRVYLSNESKHDSLDPWYIGPYTVRDGRKGANVLLRDPVSKKVKWVHLNRCKKSAANTFPMPIGLTLPDELGNEFHEESPEGVTPAEGEDNEPYEEFPQDKSNRMEVDLELGDRGTRRSSRVTRQMEFFGNPVSWNSIKTPHGARDEDPK